MGKPYKLGGDLTSATKDKLVHYCNNDKRQQHLQLLKVSSKTYSSVLVKNIIELICFCLSYYTNSF